MNNPVSFRSRALLRRTCAAAAALASLCLLNPESPAQTPGRSSGAAGSAGKTVVSYGSETLTRPELDAILEGQREAARQASVQGRPAQQLPPDAELEVIYGWLREEALAALADRMGIRPDPKQVEKELARLRKELTPERWAQVQSGSRLSVQALDLYRAALAQGTRDTPQLRSQIWQQVGSERNPAGIPRQAFDQVLDIYGRNDAAYQEMKAALPRSIDDAVAKAREQVEDHSRMTRTVDALTTQVKLDPDEVARAKQAIPAEAQKQMASAPGGFQGELLEMKKQQAADRVLRPRILAEARFADKALAGRFRSWLARQEQPEPQPQSQAQPGSRQPARAPSQGRSAR